MNSAKACVFLLIFLCNATANAAVTFEWAFVGNPGNAGDVQPQGTFGAVNEIFRISKLAVTNFQYTEFLNAVASTDTFGLYNSNMGSNPNGGITRIGVSGSFQYDIKPGQANNPVTYVSFFDAMRFVNWLENGQPIGGQTVGTTEGGVYTISDGISETRDPSAMFFIPSEHEWYKAAYHKNNGITADYWDYPTGTDTIPYSDNPGSLNTPNDSNTGNFSKDDSVANGYDDGLAVTGSTIFDSNQNYLTDVGAYAQSFSPYGTFDQGGIVFEWNEALIGFSRGERGGSWNVGPNWLAASSRLSVEPTNENFDLGFRVASLHELLGDYNGNGVVDAADYAVWRKGLGTDYTQDDYDMWRAHFGETAGNGSGSALPSADPLSAAVPEPASAVMLLTGMLAMVFRRRVVVSPFVRTYV